MGCKYVYKRGKYKGQVCNNIVSNDDFCKLHSSKQSGGAIKNKKSKNSENEKSENLESDNTVNSENRIVMKFGKKNDNMTLKNKIMSLETSISNKMVIMSHYKNIEILDSNSTEYYKNRLYIDKCLKYPWNKIFDIKELLKTKSVTVFINELRARFDEEIYGMENAKNEIINMICKFITNPHGNRNLIALGGAAGVGKSKFVKVLSDVLGIPMKVISLGGIKDTSFFLGHAYVYVESGPGKIIQNIIDAKITNPIIYFDELDKVSETEHGKDIYSFLCYLTDSSQNSEFSDHYFYGMKFDLSKVIYFFTFNDINKIDKILLDRLNIINIDTPKDDEIHLILQKHCLPEIVQNIGLSKNITFTTEQLQGLIRKFSHTIDKRVSSGIREYYRIIEKIILEINKDNLLEKFKNDSLITINDEQFEQYVNRYYTANQQDTNYQYMYI